MSREADLEARVAQLERVVTILGFYVKDAHQDNPGSHPQAVEEIVTRLCGTLLTSLGLKANEADYSQVIADALDLDPWVVSACFQDRENQ
jgi:hypothetical protein